VESRPGEGVKVRLFFPDGPDGGLEKGAGDAGAEDDTDGDRA
jgi:hypothetical protein